MMTLRGTTIQVAGPGPRAGYPCDDHGGTISRGTRNPDVLGQGSGAGLDYLGAKTVGHTRNVSGAWPLGAGIAKEITSHGSPGRQKLQ